jgi:hypothetical protein
MIEPIPPLDSSIVYLLLSRNSTGYLTLHTPENTPVNWTGYWTQKEEAQHDQMLKTLKGVKTHLYEIKLPL